MKKIIRCLSATFSLLFLLSGCNKLTDKLVDNINVAAATKSSDDDYTYEQLTKKLGTPEQLLINGTGYCYWYEERDNELLTLKVYFVSYKARSASLTSEVKEK